MEPFIQKAIDFLRKVIYLLARASRDRRLSRGEQLSVVMFAHIGILAGAALIAWQFRVGGLPSEFLTGEFGIIAVCGFLTVRVPAFRDFLEKAKTGVGREDVRPSRRAERVAATALIVAFLVQFAALASLLWATGGPIESPFAEMTLAIAVFTPFLANRGETVASVVAATIVFYALLILAYRESEGVPEPRELASVWAYFSVNVMILVGATAFTMYESLARRWQLEVEGAPGLASQALPTVDGSESRGAGANGGATGKEHAHGPHRADEDDESEDQPGLS